MRLAEVAARLPPVAGFSYRTAAYLHGLDVDPCNPIEVTVSSRHVVSTRARAAVHRQALLPSEIVYPRGMPATSALRTAADLGGRRWLVEAVVDVDMFLHARLVTLEDLRVYVSAHPGRLGVARLRRVIELAEPKSESPMESRLRMLLVRAGLPRPEAQVEIHTSDGESVARVDLYYPQSNLAIEFDGANHRERLVEDDRRQNALLSLGVSLLRFTTPDVTLHPELVALQVRHELRRGRRAAA